MIKVIKVGQLFTNKYGELWILSALEVRKSLTNKWETFVILTQNAEGEGKTATTEDMPFTHFLQMLEEGSVFF